MLRFSTEQHLLKSVMAPRGGHNLLGAKKSQGWVVRVESAHRSLFRDFYIFSQKKFQIYYRLR